MLRQLSWIHITLCLGVSPFELTLQFISLLISTVLIAMKLENDIVISWWTIFVPLWIANAMWIYFRFIIFLRVLFHYPNKRYRAMFTLFWIISFSALLTTFEILICDLMDKGKYSLSTVVIPMFIVHGMLLIRSCIYNVTPNNNNNNREPRHTFEPTTNPRYEVNPDPVDDDDANSFRGFHRML